MLCYRLIDCDLFDKFVITVFQIDLITFNRAREREIWNDQDVFFGLFGFFSSSFPCKFELGFWWLRFAYCWWKMNFFYFHFHFHFILWLLQHFSFKAHLIFYDHRDLHLCNRYQYKQTRYGQNHTLVTLKTG